MKTIIFYKRDPEHKRLIDENGVKWSEELVAQLLLKDMMTKMPFWLCLSTEDWSHIEEEYKERMNDPRD